LLPRSCCLPPYGRRVGIRIGLYEACSGFTRVTARRIADGPKAARVARLRPGQLPDRAARQLPDQSTIVCVRSSLTDGSRPRGARPIPTQARRGSSASVCFARTTSQWSASRNSLQCVTREVNFGVRRLLSTLPRQPAPSRRIVHFGPISSVAAIIASGSGVSERRPSKCFGMVSSNGNAEQLRSGSQADLCRVLTDQSSDGRAVPASALASTSQTSQPFRTAFRRLTRPLERREPVQAHGTTRDGTNVPDASVRWTARASGMPRRDPSRPP